MCDCCLISDEFSGDIVEVPPANSGGSPWKRIVERNPMRVRVTITNMAAAGGNKIYLWGRNPPSLVSSTPIGYVLNPGVSKEFQTRDEINGCADDFQNATILDETRLC